MAKRDGQLRGLAGKAALQPHKSACIWKAKDASAIMYLKSFWKP